MEDPPYFFSIVKCRPSRTVFTRNVEMTATQARSLRGKKKKAHGAALAQPVSCMQKFGAVIEFHIRRLPTDTQNRIKKNHNYGNSASFVHLITVGQEAGGVGLPASSTSWRIHAHHPIKSIHDEANDAT